VRLWSIHPKFLDTKGLVALWREALLARAVLRGLTRGYTRHPQLLRFQSHPKPLSAISAYLYEVYAEAARRGYTFDRGKVGRVTIVEPVRVTTGQIAYEWRHLQTKLRRRAPEVYRASNKVTRPAAHPLFSVKAGPIADWERPLKPSPKSARRRRKRP
jgi:hypothetical protein